MESVESSANSGDPILVHGSERRVPSPVVRQDGLHQQVHEIRLVREVGGPQEGLAVFGVAGETLGGAEADEELDVLT